VSCKKYSLKKAIRFDEALLDQLKSELSEGDSPRQYICAAVDYFFSTGKNPFYEKRQVRRRGGS
jgi:hypothetical protein